MKAKILRDGQVHDVVENGDNFSAVEEGQVLCYDGADGLQRGRVLKRRIVGDWFEFSLGDVGDMLPGLPKSPAAAAITVDAPPSKKR